MEKGIPVPAMMAGINAITDWYKNAEPRSVKLEVRCRIAGICRFMLRGCMIKVGSRAFLQIQFLHMERAKKFFSKNIRKFLQTIFYRAIINTTKAKREEIPPSFKNKKVKVIKILVTERKRVSPPEMQTEQTNR